MLYQTENVHGGDRYGRAVELDLSVNTNPLGLPPSVRQAAADSVDALEQYPDPYCRELTRAIAAHEGVPEDYILCGGGSAELIFSYCAAIKPQRALELAPTFSEYSAALGSANCQVERYPLREENGFALDRDFLDFLSCGRWDVLFLCTPNNPTGRVVDPALLRDVARLCREKNIRLFVDECFLDLSEGGESLKPLLGDYPGLFLLKAFTKSYAMAGLRLGYCLTADHDLLRSMGRSVQPWNVSIPAQAAGVAALGERDYLARTRDLLARERPYLTAGLKALGLTVCPSQANYLLFRGPEELGKNLMERGILVRDCRNYHGLGPGWYRAAVRRREENDLFLRTLGELLRGGRG